MNKFPLVSSLFQYPLKSGAAKRTSFLDLDFSGPRLDRKWMITNCDGEFITGRTHPKLVLLGAHFDGGVLTLSHPEGSLNPIETPSGKTTMVQVWKDRFEAFVAPTEANDFLSEFLGEQVLLVYSDSSKRRVRWQSNQTQAFSDAAPLLIVSHESIREIAREARLEPDPRRFRPNIVIEGIEAFAEDQIGRARIGECEIELVDSCSRCDFTLVDPNSGLVDPKGEPVASLERLRKNDLGIYLGVNAIVTKPGRIKEGDELEILSQKHGPLFAFDIEKLEVSSSVQCENPLSLVEKQGQFEDYTVLKFETKEKLNLSAGQYVSLGSKSYSVVSYLFPYLEIAVKKLAAPSSTSHAMKNLPLRTQVNLTEIGGAFPAISLSASSQLWLSAGSGVTPFLGTLESLVARNKNPSIIWLHFGNSRSEFDLIESFKKRHGEKLTKLNFVAVNTRLEERVGRNHLEAHALDIRDRVTLCCGPKGFRDECRDLATRFGLSLAKRFFVERYGPEEIALPQNLVPSPGTIGIPSLSKSIASQGNQTLLSLLQSNGVEIKHLCKSGECGRCKIRLLGGELSPLGFELLSSADKQRGLRLACVNVNKGDIEIEIN